ncbi:hypothetical protein Prudu_016144 [Prunus dulcis]|uniref:DNA recombination and repair protein Rad51-like C-terminal domain-containing protein n=1 Tax=Prunus dulcis TaxID=3755 RepID=A0A4Y1RLW6_PRUDU|nr:hypothetical protein Prudu_016144 [Prunus dulcis]
MGCGIWTGTCQAAFIGSLAEFSRIPVVVTNQVRSQTRDEACQYSFHGQSREKAVEDHTGYDFHLVAALGIHWAHAVTIRLRFIKLAKSPISPPLAFPYNITSSGITLLNDDGIELTGPEINSIHCQVIFIPEKESRRLVTSDETQRHAIDSGIMWPCCWKKVREMLEIALLFVPIKCLTKCLKGTSVE